MERHWILLLLAMVFLFGGCFASFLSTDRWESLCATAILILAIATSMYAMLEFCGHHEAEQKRWKPFRRY